MHKWITPVRKYKNDDSEGEITEIRMVSEKDSQSSQLNGNRLYFYGNINNEIVLDWNKQLDDTSRSMRIMQTMYDLEVPPPIYIYLQSNGGEIFAALSVLGRIESLKAQGFAIHTIVEGFCASAGTLISVGGTKRLIRKYSCMMIHQLSGGAWGKYSELKDEQQNLDLLMKTIQDIYKKYTKINKSDLNEILKHDIYLSAENSLEKNLVDGII
jgi:ATP-dependent Clp protease, protease subunit